MADEIPWWARDEVAPPAQAPPPADTPWWAQDQQPPQKAIKPAPDWMFPFGAPDAAKEGMGVFIQDVKDLPQSFVDTAKTLASGVGRVAHDVVNPADALSDIKAIGSGAVNAVKNIDQLPAALIKSGAEHPAQALLTALTMGTGGEGTIGKAVLQTGTKGLRAAEAIPSSILSGVGIRSQGEALKAGMTGGAEGQAFKASMRGNLPSIDIRDRALAAAEQIAADKNAARTAQASQWITPGAMAPVSDVKVALQKAQNANKTDIGAIRNQQAAAALHEIGQVIDQHTTIPPHLQLPGGGTTLSHLPVENMDALKQAIGEVMYRRDMAPKGTPARVLTSPIYDAAKNSVSSVSPKYGAAMEANAADIRNLQQLRQELSLNPKVSPGTVLAKLQSAMRNDVGSRFGYRGDLLKQLAAKDPTIPAALAGQDFSAWIPRGLAKVTAGVETGLAGHAALTGHAAALAHPGVLAGIAASIPRVQGEARYAIGSGVRGARALGLTQRNIGLAGEAARLQGLLEPEQPRSGLLQ